MTIDLKRFCANELDFREHLRAPWREGAWVYATNGHFIVRVAADAAPDAAARTDKHPDATGLFRKYLEDRTGLEFLVMPPIRALDKCLDCDGTGKVRAIKCPDCDEGEFRRGDHVYQCKNCEDSPAGAGWQYLEDYEPDQPHQVMRACESCDGLGFSIKQHGGMQIGEASYAVVYLAMLAALPQIRVCPGDPCPKHWTPQPIPAVFTFDGGHALLMPRRD